MQENNKLNDEVLEEIYGGKRFKNVTVRTVTGLQKGFLALRSMPFYSQANELGALFNGDVVYSTEMYQGSYVWVYADCRANSYHGKKQYSGYGFVNSGYLT